MTDQGTATVRVSRTLNAAVEDVFDAWTDADRLQQWLLPGPGTVARAECDPVVGGRFRIAKLFPTGVDEVTGRYLVVEPPHRLVFTWESPGTTGGRQTRVTVTLRADGDTTDMTILHERFPAEPFADGARAAWTSIAAKLETHLTRPTAA
ncbi:SRPBCC domain-containing protein [Actinomadura sp. WMMA1423]|uniref:SRPBCC family protein n=1 Tax=Actinomadura sp. WMMA1423 TaxID=2591108 RepID=UPI00143DBE32|nr:SRPBCC domain-containing protein [Actinomadura sp. WMMA1423]